MANVLLDSSSAIALALASDDRDVVTGDTETFYRRHADIDAAILAFTIYDDVWFDRPSIERNLERLSSLKGIVRIAGELYARVDEDEIYRAIDRTHVERLQPASTLAVKADQALGGELGITRYGPTSSWRHVEQELSGTAASVSFRIGKKLLPNSTADVCAVLLRTFYYDALHQMAGCDLVLHPLKASVYEPPADESAKVLGKSVLDNFDADVRREFYERKARWLARRDTRIETPMLTEYVLRQCKSWSDLPQVVSDLRESRQARRFRIGITELNEARLRDDNREIDKILAALDAARLEWQKALPAGGLKTTITLSVPFLRVLGVEKDFRVPDVKLNKSAADRLLGFVHLLLQKS